MSNRPVTVSLTPAVVYNHGCRALATITEYTALCGGIVPNFENIFLKIIAIFLPDTHFSVKQTFKKPFGKSTA